MAKDFLKGAKDEYDVVVIGSGLAGLTSANILARAGYSVLLLEHHYQLGGMATWFKRRNGHIFDISLHGFPHGMIKSCRKYWTREIADSIVQLKGIRFENPQFSLKTTFDRDDFTRIITEEFKIKPEVVSRFFDTARSMNFYDEQNKTTRELFEEFFPGRDDAQGENASAFQEGPHFLGIKGEGFQVAKRVEAQDVQVRFEKNSPVRISAAVNPFQSLHGAETFIERKDDILPGQA